MAKESKLARSSGAGEDRLSSLPDEILINNILSLLPMRDAQRTSILARSWRYLWLYVPCLDLEGSEKVLRFPRSSQSYSIILHERAASKYAEWVDGIISTYRGSTILSHFRVLFRLDSILARKIDSWLEFSLRQGVEVLELDCCWRANNGNSPYRFLSIKPSWFPNIRLLKSLTLKAVQISSDSLEHLLSGCEFLERLQLAKVSSLIQVNVTGPVSRLKHVDIYHCVGLKSITIRSLTPDLVSFTYPLEVLHIEHAPRLVDLFIDHYHFSDLTYHPLFHYLSQLETLHLAVCSRHENMDRLNRFPVLSRLKHLKLTKNFGLDASDRSVLTQGKPHWVASLIKKAPFLQHLTLEVSNLGQPRYFRKELADMHLQLRVPVIEIAGFKGRKVDCMLALHLVKASPSLEKLILDLRDPLRRGCMLGPYEYSDRIIKKWRKVAKEHIEPRLPPKAKLVLI